MNICQDNFNHIFTFLDNKLCIDLIKYRLVCNLFIINFQSINYLIIYLLNYLTKMKPIILKKLLVHLVIIIIPSKTHLFIILHMLF